MRDRSDYSRRDFVRFASTTVLAGCTGGRVFGDNIPKVPTVPESIARDVAEAPLAMTFKGTTAEECRKWQAEFGEKLSQLLGPHDPPKAWKTATKLVADLPDHRREELVLTADGHQLLPIYLLLPRPKATKKVPGIVALHGHGEFGHHAVAGRDDLPGVAKAIEGSNYDYGRQLVRRGYAVAIPCLTPFGDRLGDQAQSRKSDLCADTFIRMQMLGKLLIAENLRDCRWAASVLANHDEVNAEKLGCVGLSYGGRMTTLTAALEPQIKIAIISGALNVMQERLSKPYGCGAQIIPGLLKYGDVPEIASLIAPRPLLFEVGSRDKLLPEKWVDEALTRIKRAYQALGAADRLRVDRFDGGHRWNGVMAFPMLDQFLK